jgi:quinol monooxygenase YgiN
MGDELGRRLAVLVEPARAEPGNINYDLHRSNEDPDVWVLYENWKAPSDLAAHFELPYMKAFVAALPEVLEGEMDLRRCTMVSKVAAWPPRRPCRSRSRRSNQGLGEQIIQPVFTTLLKRSLASSESGRGEQSLAPTCSVPRRRE